jgi:hypothetical protein
MYYAVVATLMFAFPLLSVAIEAIAGRSPFSAALIGKWFVFWSVGIRLFTAGVRQILQPEYTAHVILGLENDESLLLVRELGFANLALGLVGMLSLVFPTWRLPVTLAGGVFFGLAGVNHVLESHRNQLENVAMASDLFVSAILLMVCFVTGLHAWSSRRVNAA